MNKVILLGRLTRDPDVNTINGSNGAYTVARFAVAVDRRYKQDGGQAADFPSIVAFGKTGDFVAKYFKQGMKIAIDGHLQTGSYEKDGVKHYTTDVIAENVEFAESKKADDTPPPSGNEWVSVPEGINNDLPFK